MPDDFDLFPDRKNLDPFAFGKEEKAVAAEHASEADKPGAEGDKQAPAGRKAAAPSGEPLPSLFDKMREPTPPVAAPAPGAGRTRVAEPRPSSPETARKGPSKVLVIAFVAVLILAAVWAVKTFLPGGGSAPPASAPGGGTAGGPAPEPAAAAPATPPAPAAPAPASPATPPTAPAAASPAVKPVTPSKPPTAPTPAKPVKETRPAASVPGKGFFVQVGGATVKENLDALGKKLRETGYEPVLVPGVVKGKAAGPVVLAVGPFPGLSSAQAAAGRVQESGLPAILVKGAGEEYMIKAGSYPTEAAAQPSLARVNKLGLPARLDGQAGGSAPLRITLVRVGPFPDEPTAVRVRDELAGKGFAPILIRP